MTPGDMRVSVAVFEVWEVPPRRKPRASLHPARNSRRCVRLFADSDHPSDQWTSPSAYPRQPGGLPFSSPPRRATVSRCPARLLRPLTQPYNFRSEKTTDKNLKKHDDLDHHAVSLLVVGLGDSIRFISYKNLSLICRLRLSQVDWLFFLSMNKQPLGFIKARADIFMIL